VKHVVEDERLNSAVQVNLRHALNVALTQLPEVFTENELFTAITAISYTGETRLEDPEKVNKIVAGSLETFRILYADIIAQKVQDGSITVDGDFIQLQTSESIQFLYDILPSNLKSRVEFSPDISIL
jgi:mitochondrial translocator assembly and maintenance protein 41